MKKKLFLYVLFVCLFVSYFYIVSVDEAMTPKEMREARIQDKIDKRKRGYAKPDKPNEFEKYLFDGRKSLKTGKVTRKPNQLLNEFNSKVKEKMSNSNAKNKATNLNWKSRGPGNVGGRTRALVVDASDATKNTWIVGAASGGIWKTTDRGDSWANLSDNQLPNLAINSMVQSKSNHSIFYAGTGEGYGNTGAVKGAGVFKSVDGAATWTQLSATATGDDAENFFYVNRLLVDPASSDIVLAATNSGIYKSTDGGISWNEKFANGNRVQQIIVNPLNFATMYAAVRNYGVLKSMDAGETWIRKTLTLEGGRIELAISPSDTSRLYAAVDATETALYMTDDGGESWFLSKTNTSGNWLSGQGWYNNTLIVDPDDANTVIAGGLDLYKTIITENSKDTSSTLETYSTTDAWMSFVNYGGNLLGNGGSTANNWNTSLTDKAEINVEFRFGPGFSQKAHRFQRESDGTYTYLDYVDVAYEVWDITNGRQLMTSFRDNNASGDWDLDGGADNNGIEAREYIFAHDVVYNENSPDANIAVTGSFGGTIASGAAGFNYELQYAFWGVATDETHYSSSAGNIPESKVIFFEPTTVYGIQRSADERLSVWSAAIGSSTYVHADHHSTHYVPVDGGEDYMIFTNDGGIFISTDKGDSFNEKTLGYITSQFYGAAKHPTEDRYIGGMQDNGTWRTKENIDTTNYKWDEMLGGDGYDVVWHSQNPLKIAGTLYYSDIRTSENGGATWTQRYSAGEGNAPFITTLASSLQRPDMLYAVRESGIIRSSDFGQTWNVIAYPTSGLGERFASRGEVKVSLANPDIVWASSLMWESNNLTPIVSVDGGLTFNSTNPSNYGFSHFSSGLATHPYRDSVAYVTFSSSNLPKVIRTQDLGNTWEDISGTGAGALPDVDVYDILVIPDTTKVIYTLWAGTEIGLFISDDGGANWYYANNGLPAVSIWDFKLYGDQVVVATHGRGIWTVNLNNIGEAKEDLVELDVDILQNPSYPNNGWFFVKSSHELSSITGTYTQGAKVSSFSFEDFSSFASSEVMFYDKAFKISGSDSIVVEITTKSAFTNASKVDNYVFKTFFVTASSGKQSLAHEDASVNFPEGSFSKDLRIVMSTEKIKESILNYDREGTDYNLSLFPQDEVLETDFSVEFSVDERTLKLGRIYTLDRSKKWVALKTFIRDGKLLAKHHKLGHFKVFIDNTVDKQVITTASKVLTFELGDNYPNPFNPITTIPFQLEHPKNVKLLIYNSLGQLVKELANRQFEEGTHSLVWNGKNSIGKEVSSGLYFYQLITNTKTITKKMILLK